MATLALQPARLVKSRDGKPAECETITGVTGLNPGEICVKANGALAACSNDAVVVTHLATFDSDAQYIPGTTAYSGPYVKIKPGDTYEMNAYHATPASAVVADTDLDAQPGYNLVKVGDNWHLNLAATNAPAVRLIARRSDCSATDIYPRVLVQFLPTVTQDS
jgi:hypothetical protein